MSPKGGTLVTIRSHPFMPTTSTAGVLRAQAPSESFPVARLGYAVGPEADAPACAGGGGRQAAPARGSTS